MSTNGRGAATRLAAWGALIAVAGSLVAVAAVRTPAALAATPSGVAGPMAVASMAAGINPIHPLFPVLDAAGQPVIRSGGEVSVARTCSGCHDAGWIAAHNTHQGPVERASCLDCHFAGGELPRQAEAYDTEGRLRREHLRLAAPTDQACGRCHRVVAGADEAVLLPDDLARGAAGGETGGRAGGSASLTLETGAIVSAQNLSASYLNLAGKEVRDYPWDVHARRLVGCIACHYAPNHPARTAPGDSTLAYLKADPRRLALSEYLQRPDHRLASAACASCHDPAQAHAFLPYRARHLQVLDCAACHIPRPMGPAARAIDATVVRPDGSPRVEYRGMAGDPDESPNAAFIEGYEPLLLASESDGRLAPHNAIDRWCWASGSGGAPVAPEVVAAAWLERPEGGGYRPEILATFDADHDGRLDDLELRLDRPEKAEQVRSNLLALGVADPVIRREVTLHRVAHGVMEGDEVLGDCDRCHAPDSRLAASLPLGSFQPAGADPTPQLAPADGERLRLWSVGSDWVAAAPAAADRGLHLFGHARGGWSDRAGFLLFLLVLAGASLHALLRLRAAGRREHPGVPLRRAYLYTRYERIWHWLMAASVLILVVTGLQVHLAGAVASAGLPRAVAVHNLFAVILLANGFLSLFYHVTTAAIRQFVPSRQGLLARIVDQARFYTRGIFLGQPHPLPRTPDRKLNPLQQMTYLALLNVLFPFQAATGILIWGAARWPEVAAAVGGLRIIAPLHNLGSWLFLSFIVLHVYLTTTGHTVLANIRAMIDGHDEIEVEAPARAGGADA